MARRAIEEDPHTSICELSTRCGLSRGTIERIIYEYLHKKKDMRKVTTPSAGRRTEETDSGLLKETARKFWAWWNQTTVRHSDRRRNLDILLWHPQRAVQSDCGWTNMNSDRWCFVQDFRAESDFSLTFFLPIRVALLPWTFCLRNLHWLPHTAPKRFFPKTSSPCMTSTQWPEPASTSMPVPTRPRSHNRIQVLDRPPYSPDLAPCDFVCSELNERLAGRQFTRVQDPFINSRNFRSERYTCFRVPKCSWDVAEATIILCSQGIYFEGLKEFPFYITCDRTFQLAVVLEFRLFRRSHACGANYVLKMNVSGLS